jgi:hypothetical protein
VDTSLERCYVTVPAGAADLAADEFAGFGAAEIKAMASGTSRKRHEIELT